MRVAILLLAFAALAAASSVSEASFLELAQQPNQCFPNCKWHCDDPQCPAHCEPQCEKPTCELRCEKLAATKCDIRCEKPRCEVRCSRNNCGAGGCPLCENVCMPAKCQTVCTPAVPNCKPTCTPPKCTWSCKKPSTCPKPKCSLGCEARPGQGMAQNACAGKQCCSCNNGANVAIALELASAHHENQHGFRPHEEILPSFVEVAHEMRLREQVHAETQCCPCGGYDDE